MAKTIVETKTAELCIDGDKDTNLFSLLSSNSFLDLTKDKSDKAIGIKTIGSKAFDHKKRIEHIVLPCELVEIKEYAFDTCDDLISVKFDSTNGTKEIDSTSNLLIQSNAFADCKNLDSVHIKCNKLTLEKDAFAGCYKLRIVYLECKELDFRQNAFSNSSELTVYGQKQYFASTNSQKISFDLEGFCKRNSIQFTEV